MDKEVLWETYFNAFPQEFNQIYRKRAAHDCSACRNFIRNYGNVVALVNNKIVSMWDFDINSDEYSPSVKSIANLVKSAPIKNVFVYKLLNDLKIAALGIDFNRELLENQSVLTWHHLHLILPDKFINKSSESVEAIEGDYRTNRETFEKSLDVLSLDAIDIVLELMISKDAETNEYNLYRGIEHKGSVEAFKKFKIEYDSIPEDEKDGWLWLNSIKAGEALCNFKERSIGTLIKDISRGVDIDEAAHSFGNKMDGYKRPKNTIITKQQIELAQKQIIEMGFSDSLGRRFAIIDDITINNVVFANKDSKKAMNVFDELKNEIPITPKTSSRVEDVTIENFIKNILPNVSNINLFFENKHCNNLVSLIAPINKEAPTMFKWNNNFSWSYNNDVTDTIKESVKARGGNVNGVLRFSIRWAENGKDNSDLDAHCIEPDGTEIFYNNKNDYNTTGNLDVDITQPETYGDKDIVENITWSDKSKMQKGVYRFFVRQFKLRGENNGFTAEIEFNGEIHQFNYTKPLENKEDVFVANVEYSKANGFKIIKSMDSTISSKSIWEINTNQFQKVSTLMYSPNYWDAQCTGNKHYFFMLEGCINPDTPRGFFNEFLKEDLLKQKRVFEVLGSKMKVEPSNVQLSGLGFSSTNKNSVIAMVEGAFNRTIKINF